MTRQLLIQKAYVDPNFEDDFDFNFLGTLMMNKSERNFFQFLVPQTWVVLESFQEPQLRNTRIIVPRFEIAAFVELKQGFFHKATTKAIATYLALIVGCFTLFFISPLLQTIVPKSAASAVGGLTGVISIYLLLSLSKSSRLPHSYLLKWQQLKKLDKATTEALQQSYYGSAVFKNLAEMKAAYPEAKEFTYEDMYHIRQPEEEDFWEAPVLLPSETQLG